HAGRFAAGAAAMLFVIGCAVSVPPAFSQSGIPLDAYGGYRDINATGGATGAFRIEKMHDRWIFVTPDGHPLWLRSVYGLNKYDGGDAYQAALWQKYMPKKDPNWNPEWFPWPQFAAATVKRIKQWGFNAIGEYAANYVWPDRNSEKAPMLYTLGAANYSLRYGGVKDLIHGTDPARYTGWRG